MVRIGQASEAKQLEAALSRTRCAWGNRSVLVAPGRLTRMKRWAAPACGQEMVSWNRSVTDRCVGMVESVILTRTVYFPDRVGLPEMTPVLLLRLSPGGSAVSAVKV
jgi:hypothetical protein